MNTIIPNSKTTPPPQMKSDSRDLSSGRYDFIGLAPLMGWISLITFLVAIGLIAFKGFRYGIDFAGGTEMQVKFKQSVPADQVRALISELGLQTATVQSLDKENNEYIIRFEAGEGKNDKEINRANNVLIQKVSEGLKAKLPLAEGGILRVDSVGPQVGSDLKRNSILATFYSLLLILIYVGLRFDIRYAPGAVICLFHDAVVTLGLYSLFDWEVNIQVLAAVLTVIGYSINDTIINFDRIRENLQVYPGRHIRWVINRSTNDVLSRTILTAGSTFMSVLALYLLGTGSIKDLALALGIGIILGTYSSVYVAAPFVLLLDKFSGKKVE